MKQILAGKNELGLPLARHFLPFRRPVVNECLYSVSRENALFALATALPNIVPSLDRAALGGRRVRERYGVPHHEPDPDGVPGRGGERQPDRLSGAKGGDCVHHHGSFRFSRHRPGADGKGSLRRWVDPQGGDRLAGTYVVGLSLERYYRIGYGLTRDERRREYEIALTHGKSVAELLLAGLERSRRRVTVVQCKVSKEIGYARFLYLSGRGDGDAVGRRRSLKDGRIISGAYLGGTASQVRIDLGDKVASYNVADITRIEFACLGSAAVCASATPCSGAAAGAGGRAPPVDAGRFGSAPGGASPGVARNSARSASQGTA